MNVKFFVVFFSCRKQEEMDAICAFTPDSEGIQGMHSKFRIFRIFGSKMRECQILRGFRGAKSVNIANFSKPGSKKCECKFFVVFFSAGNKRRWMQYVHLRQILRESKGCTASSEFFVLLRAKYVNVKFFVVFGEQKV